MKKMLSIIFITGLFIAGVNQSNAGGTWLVETIDVASRAMRSIRSKIGPFTPVDGRLMSSKASRSSPVVIGNPCIDALFQYGLSDSKIASHFLNAVLSLKGEKSIKTVEFLQRDMPSSNPLSSLGYAFTVDVRCRTRDGRNFLVEMQNDFRDDYHLKSLIEHSRMLGRLDVEDTQEDLYLREKSNKNDKFKFWKSVEGLYSVVVTNKSFPLTRMKKVYQNESLMEPDLVNPYELRHVHHLERHYGDIPHQIVLLMLDHLKTETAEKMTSPIEGWAYVFRDSSLSSGVRKISETKQINRPDLLAKLDPAIQDFIDRLNVEHLPGEVRERYHSAVKYYNDSIVDIEMRATARGESMGIEKGREEGKNIQARETVLKMNKMTIEIDIISEATNLTREAVEKIIKEEETPKDE